jgi:uncharacterized OsmC-like protein
MAEPVHEFTIAIEQVRDYEFRVRFDKANLPELVLDEPPPLGRDAGPNPSRILAAAIGNCLAASLLFCARKARANIESLRAQVKTQIARNEQKRLRVPRVEVTIEVQAPEADREAVRRCLPLFEDFCTVTQSIREGIEVQVAVRGLNQG